MLKKFLFLQIEQMKMEEPGFQVIIQQDGAPLHFANDVKEELNCPFPSYGQQEVPIESLRLGL